MKRWSVAPVLLICLVSCQEQPPAYESHYVPPTSTPLPPPVSSPAPPVTEPQASFVDTFDRPDTVLGLGEGWDLRGPYADGFPLPAATDGFISNGSYTYAGDSIVYAVRQFSSTVQRMGTVGRWRKTGDGAETTLAMAITANDQLITDVVHFTANRSDWELTVSRGSGSFEPVARGLFSPMLTLDSDYQFEFEATDDTLTVRVPGNEVTINVSTDGLLGDRAFWEEYPSGTPAGVVFDFDTVWAAEDGQTLFPVSE